MAEQQPNNARVPESGMALCNGGPLDGQERPYTSLAQDPMTVALVPSEVRRHDELWFGGVYELVIRGHPTSAQEAHTGRWITVHVAPTVEWDWKARRY